MTRACSAPSTPSTRCRPIRGRSTTWAAVGQRAVRVRWSRAAGRSDDPRTAVRRSARAQGGVRFSAPERLAYAKAGDRGLRRDGRRRPVMASPVAVDPCLGQRLVLDDELAPALIKHVGRSPRRMLRLFACPRRSRSSEYAVRDSAIAQTADTIGDARTITGSIGVRSAGIERPASLNG